MQYVIALDAGWRTRSARVSSRSQAGASERALEADGPGRWRVDGVRVPELDGCMDVDLESSALTNAFPVHRLRLDRGDEAQAPAAYARALGLAVERLEQRYQRLENDGDCACYTYESPAFGFACRLRYDPSGLVLDYPEIATRVR